MGLSAPPTRPNIERLSDNQRSVNSVKYLLRNTNFYDNKSNKIILTDAQIEKLDFLFKQYYSDLLSSREVLLDLRGGDGLTDVIVLIEFVIFVNWYDSLFGVQAFVSTSLTYQDPLGWLSGKFDQRNASNQQSRVNPASRFERETLAEIKQMSVASADENGFVMSYDEALSLFRQTYIGSIPVTEYFKIGGWQAVKHLVHAKGVGVNPEDYGMTQAELRNIGKKIDGRGGIVAYVQRGNRLPSVEHVKAYQEALKNICLNPSTTRRDDSKYYNLNGITPATVFKNDQYIISFNQITNDLITGYKHRIEAVERYERTNQLGAQDWIDQWSTESN